jgi:hypothetical protein
MMGHFAFSEMPVNLVVEKGGLSSYYSYVGYCRPHTIHPLDGWLTLVCECEMEQNRFT